MVLTGQRWGNLGSVKITMWIETQQIYRNQKVHKDIYKTKHLSDYSVTFRGCQGTSTLFQKLVNKGKETITFTFPILRVTK